MIHSNPFEGEGRQVRLELHLDYTVIILSVFEILSSHSIIYLPKFEDFSGCVIGSSWKTQGPDFLKITDFKEIILTTVTDIHVHSL